jgi:hypothetical protein
LLMPVGSVHSFHRRRHCIVLVDTTGRA